MDDILGGPMLISNPSNLSRSSTNFCSNYELVSVCMYSLSPVSNSFAFSLGRRRTGSKPTDYCWHLAPVEPFSIIDFFASKSNLMMQGIYQILAVGS